MPRSFAGVKRPTVTSIYRQDSVDASGVAVGRGDGSGRGVPTARRTQIGHGAADHGVSERQ